MFLPLILSQSTLPLISERVGANAGKEEVDWFVFTFLKGTALFVFPVAVFVALASPLILGFYGSEYRDGVYALAVLAIAAAASAPINFIENYLAAKDKMSWNLATMVFWAGVNLLLVTLLAPEFGAVGVAIAYLCAYIVRLTLSLFLISLAR
jgi:O-antigen/teichoic acid export membrane protein